MSETAQLGDVLILVVRLKVKQVEARGLLAPVYGWFTEGFDTIDEGGEGFAR